MGFFPNLKPLIDELFSSKFDKPTGTNLQYIAGNGTLITFPTFLSSDSLIATMFNQTGSTVPSFTVVYINGVHGNLPTLALAKADSESTSSKTYAITSMSISNNNSGGVVTDGKLKNVNTSAFTEGDSLWLSPTTAGGITTTKPSAPNHAVFLGTITRVHTNQGEVQVRIQNGFELQELHNVTIDTPLDSQSLVYDNSTSLWKNSSKYLDWFTFIWKLFSGFTIAELRLLTNSQLALVTYFSCKEEGRIKDWYYDSTDTTSIDNNGTILVTTSGKVLKAINYDYVNIKNFGAKGDSTYAYVINQTGSFAGNDDTTPIQNAINYCLKTGKPLKVDIGWYRITSPIVVTGSMGITMIGEGTPPEISSSQYSAGIDVNMKGAIFIRDYTGDSLFTFRGGLNSSDSNWSNYRDGKMWKTNISNIGFIERNSALGADVPTTNTTSLVLAKRSILMRFKNCLFLGASTSNFEGFLIDDSIFDDCRFISSGSRIASPSLLLHRITTIAGESTYDATNSLYINSCIFEGNRGQNILTSPANYTRADGTVFSESGTFAALQIIGGILKFPRLDATCSSLNNCELNNVGGGMIISGLSHKGNTDGTTSNVTEILKIYNSASFYVNCSIEKLQNNNLSLTRFITLQGCNAITANVQLVDYSAGITGTEAVFVSSAGGNNNYITGSVSTVTGTKKLTNRFWQFLPSLDSDPPAVENGSSIFVDNANRFGWVGANGFSRKFDGTANTADRIYTLPDVSGTIAVSSNANTFSAPQSFEGTGSAISGIVRGLRLKTILNATANNDFLYGFVLEPAYNDNGFSNIVKINQIRLNGATMQIVGSSSIIEFSSNGIEQSFNFQGVNYINATQTGASLRLRATNDVSLGNLINSFLRVLSSGNTLLQNGGAFTDDGNRLQVDGNISLKTAGNGIKIPTGTGSPKGSATLTSGVSSSISVTGMTTSSNVQLTLETIGGTVTTTWQYKVTKSAGSFIITAITNTGATNTLDTSTIGYYVTI